MVRSREKGNLNFLQGFLWTDKRFHYLQISIQMITIVSLICATSEIVLGSWSLNILSTKIHPKLEISSTKSKHVAIGIAIFLTLSARITALIFWIRSTQNEHLQIYSVTSHCTFLTVFCMLGLGGLLIYFVSASLELSTGSFRPHTEVLLAFSYIAGFDILFTATFGLAVVKDLQCRIRREWEYGVEAAVVSRENWVRPQWRELAPVHEVYV